MPKDLHCPDCGAVISGDLFSADKSRRRFFAAIRDIHASLPDALRQRFPTSEVLRKQALIAVQWCDVATIVAGSKKAAPAIAAFLKMKDPYCLIQERGEVLTIYTARSMSRQALKGREFHTVTDAAFAWIEEQTGINPNQWSEAA